MPFERSDLNHAERKIVADAVPIEAEREHDDELQARRNRRPLEIFYIISRSGDLGHRNVIALGVASCITTMCDYKTWP